MLALHGRPLAQADIARVLGVSRSLISTAVSELVEWGLIRPVGAHRNAPYEADLDVWSVITSVLRQREWMMIESTRVALEAALEEAELEAAGGGVPAFSVKRIRTLLRMTEMAQTFLKGLLSLRAPRAPDSMQSWVTRAVSFLKGLRKG